MKPQESTPVNANQAMMRPGRVGAAHRHGQALIPVLFVLLILTSLAITFAVAAHSDLRAGANFANRTSRAYAARGALNYALAALSSTSNNGAMYGTVPTNPEADANGWWQIGDAWVKVEAVDTASRLDLNSVTATTLNTWPIFQTNTELAQAIVSWRTPQSTDSSSTGTGAMASGVSGASSSTDPFSSYYEGLTPSYQEKNAPFETVDELLLVEGITPALLYGTIPGESAVTEATNPTIPSPAPVGRGVSVKGAAGRGASLGSAVTRQSGAKASVGATTGQTGGTGAAAGSQTATSDFSSIFSASTIPMSELFTTLSREREIATDGTPRININTATATDLQNIGLTAAQANSLIQYRQSGGQGGAGNGVTAVLGIGAGATTGGGVTAKKSVRLSRQAAAKGGAGAAASGAGKTGGTTGTGSTTGAKTGATGTGGAGGTTAFKTLGDLLAAPGMTATILQQIADHIAIDGNTYREHVVNVNTAPQEVLASVPGMDTTTLNAILTARQSGQTFQTMGDLFTLQGVSVQEYQAVINSLTTKASTYIIRIKVLMPGESAVYAVEALAELTDNGPLVLQWREVPSTPGWTSWTAPPTLPQATGQGASTTGSVTGG